METYISKTGLVLQEDYTIETLKELLRVFEILVIELEENYVNEGIFFHLLIILGENKDFNIYFKFLYNNKPKEDLHKNFYCDKSRLPTYFWEIDNKQIRIAFCNYLISLLEKELKIYNNS